MSSVDKSTIEDLQTKESTLKKCFDRVGKPIIRENYVREFFMKNGLLYSKHLEMTMPLDTQRQFHSRKLLLRL